AIPCHWNHISCGASGVGGSRRTRTSEALPHTIYSRVPLPLGSCSQRAPGWPRKPCPGVGHPRTLQPPPWCCAVGPSCDGLTATPQGGCPSNTLPLLACAARGGCSGRESLSSSQET